MKKKCLLKQPAQKKEVAKNCVAYEVDRIGYPDYLPAGIG